MDPFKQDPDVDDESPHPLHSSQTFSQGIAEGRHQDGEMTDEAEDGPPPSVMLDIPTSDGGHSSSPRGGASPRVTAPLLQSDSDGPARSVYDDAQPHPRESVRLGKMKASTVPPGYQDDEDEEQDEGVVYDEEDEEAGLMDQRRGSSSPAPSRGGGGRAPHRKVGGSIIADLADRVRRKADRIRRQDTGARKRQAMRGLDPKERALWNWANVDNLDEFLQEVYSYYIGKGIFCIALSRALNLLTIAFVIGFSTFLAGCVNYSKIRDYSKLRHSQKPAESEVDLMLSDVLVDQCVSR